MYENPRLIEGVISRLRKAEDQTMASYRSTEIEHEENITDRLLGNFAGKLDDATFQGVHWTAKTLTSKGPNSQETQHGADFIGVLNLKLPGYTVKKGFLAQAKRAEPGVKMKPVDVKRMRAQCRAMLDRSPVSYVFVYSKTEGVRVVSAMDVLGATTGNPLDLNHWSLSQFFQSHMQCFIGDRGITAANRKQLEVLISRVQTRAGLVIKGSGVELGSKKEPLPGNLFR